MLNFDVKRKINTLRDILVGKVPDPKAQVEQITIAMIYKFMDDIDLEGVELGGTRQFFQGIYEKYAWSNLMQSENSGYQRVALYGEGIDKMAINPDLPQLFRDIFRGAYVPYRDPETLNMFLKEINDFTYDNSEDLGNAFEYLLSIMGSQGDAGQFRTPRHIINMMVEIVAPKKNETILDPACGTAGFLISAYKYIQAQNTDNDNNSTLTADDKKRMVENFAGYDISPDMVRLSRVNMYLHGFTKPQISDYDTLTKDEKWNDSYDVILANPPFMTPKGGIIPHNRFRIQAKRSEVLFVDYIAEHLNPQGRAAIIVPEGIVFQLANAYKDLRKFLVEDGFLYAVVSLPAGVFNPYSGVKTSVLFFDRTLAKQKDEILFIKINNDGYDLGAQRREIKENDIPKAIRLVKDFQKGISLDSSTSVTTALKKDIAEREYILVGDRYISPVTVESKWPMLELGEVCEVERGASPRPIKDYITDSEDGINWIKIGDGEENSKYICSTKEKITREAAEKSRRVYKGDLILSNSMSFGRPYIMGIDGCVHDGWLIIKNSRGLFNPLYLCYILGSDIMMQEYARLATGGVVNNLNSSLVRSCRIPIPPLAVQEEIIAVIETFQKIIDGARLVVDNYKPTINNNPSWPIVKIGDVCELNPKKSEVSELDEDTLVSFVPMADINDQDMFFSAGGEKPIKDVYSGYTYFRDNDVLLAKVTPCFENGKSGIAKNLRNGIGFGSSEFYVLRAHSKLILPDLIYYTINSKEFIRQGKNNMTGTGGLQRLTKDYVMEYPIALPPLETQQQIVTSVSEEIAIVEQNKRLIEIFEQKIKDKISEVWGE